MKTLDEVINALETDPVPMAYTARLSVHEDIMTDALYHLNKYRMTLDDIVAKRKALEDEITRYQEAVRNCEAAENKYCQLAQNLGEVGNDPLTWYKGE